jgi:protein-S-isoprenylcysteine O-methyltransferase Ste14
MLVKLGNIFYHYRNYFFPLLYAALFIPSDPLFVDPNIALISGAILIFLGMFVRCITVGLVYIVRGGQNRRIYAEGLVTGGIYQICRNPMYLGNILLLIGFALFSNSVLYMIVFIPLMLFIYLGIIKAEEAFLYGKFGEQYLAFKNSTNAIIPKLGRINRAFQGHNFRYKLVLANEHNGIFMYSSGMIFLLLYQKVWEMNQALTVFAVLLLFFLISKWMKRSGRLYKD